MFPASFPPAFFPNALVVYFDEVNDFLIMFFCKCILRKPQGQESCSKTYLGRYQTFLLRESPYYIQ